MGTDAQRSFALVIAAGMISRLVIGIFVVPALYKRVARLNDVLKVCSRHRGVDVGVES